MICLVSSNIILERYDIDLTQSICNSLKWYSFHVELFIISCIPYSIPFLCKYLNINNFMIFVHKKICLLTSWYFLIQTSYCCRPARFCSQHQEICILCQTMFLLFDLLFNRDTENYIIISIHLYKISNIVENQNINFDSFTPEFQKLGLLSGGPLENFPYRTSNFYLYVQTIRVQPWLRFKFRFTYKFSPFSSCRNDQ